MVKRSASEISTDSRDSYYLTCTDNGSDKFYLISINGLEVATCYGRSGTAGKEEVKKFSSIDLAEKFFSKTVKEKQKKGYVETILDDTDTSAVKPTHPPIPNHAPSPVASTASSSATPSSAPVASVTSISPADDLLAQLESGQTVEVAGNGSSKYKLRKFNGGYSCSCLGFVTHIKRNGIQANSCKHLKEIRGEQAEVERCQSSRPGGTSGGGNAAPAAGSEEKNLSIVKKVSLAQQWKTTMDPAGYAMSEKLDGMRGYWSAGRLWSRTGNLIQAPEWFLEGLPVDMELDGELFLGRQQFSQTVSIARRSDASEEWRQLRYVVFDAPGAAGGIMERLAVAHTALSAGDGAKFAAVHPHSTCEGADHLLQELARVEQLGGEGLMLRRATALHRGGRSSDLLKVKSFHDDEALITGHEAGKGKYQGMVGSLICVNRAGVVFKVGSGLTDSQRVPSAAPKVGTVITYKYFELTEDKVPRFPTYLREAPGECPKQFAQSSTV